MEKNDIIEVDEKEYLVYEMYESNHTTYAMLCPVENENPLNEGIVVKVEEDNTISSLETEEEIKEAINRLEKLQKE